MNRLFGRTAALVCALSACSLYSQAQSCNNASFSGSYFYSLSGAVANNGNINTPIPYSVLGKFTTDGNGNLTGFADENAAGSIRHLTLSGTYSVNADCTGTEALTTSASGGQPNTTSAAFRIIPGQQNFAITTSGIGQELSGRVYRSLAQGTSQCSNGSANGTYGFLLTGTDVPSLAAASVAGSIVLDGNGHLTFQTTTNEVATGATALNGTGSYTINADCTGTASFAIGGLTSAANVALVEGGQVIFLQADSTRTGTGIGTPRTVLSVLPQVAFGGGWYTAFYFSNTTGSSVTFPVNFIADDGTPLTVPSVGGATASVLIPAHGSAIIEAPNTGNLVQGYASFTLPPGVTGYGVFRQSVVNKSDQEAVVQLSSAVATVNSLAYDETAFTTSVAIVNPNAFSITVNITVRDNSGNVIGTSPINLAANRKTESILRNLPGLSGMVGTRGTAQFVTSTGNVVVLGIRFGSSAFTSIPASQN